MTDLENFLSIPVKDMTEDIVMSFLKKNVFFFKYIRIEDQTEKICIYVLAVDPFLISLIPHKNQTSKICKTAVSVPSIKNSPIDSTTDILQCISPKYRYDKELMEIAVKNRPSCLKSTKQTNDLCRIALKSNGISLVYVKPYLYDNILFQIAVENNGMSLQYVPKKFFTVNVVETAVKQNGLSIQYVPEKFMTEKVMSVAVENKPEIIEFNFLQSESLCMKAIKLKPSLFSLIEKKNLTPAIYRTSFFLGGCPFEEFPKELQTEEIALKAVKRDGMNLKFVKTQTENICVCAYKENIYSMMYINEEFRYLYERKKAREEDIM
jgi:hypothetical protein